MARLVEAGVADIGNIKDAVMKVNWTIHGGGSDGYYYNKEKLTKNKEMHKDFVSVKYLFDEVNKVLPEGKKIESLKIFRWTSPGAVIVSNVEIDDVFRGVFEHPYWPQLYTSAKWRTRAGMGQGSKHLSKTAGEDVVTGVHGPGELMKDLQLFMYESGDDDGDVFLNELLSTEYVNKYSQATSSDFGIWLLHDTRNWEDAYPEFEKRVQVKDQDGARKEAREAKKLHEKIFQTKKGEAGETPEIKMTEAIKQIIKTLSENYTGDTFPKHWEFFPITCSPMSGVEGRAQLTSGIRRDEDGRFKSMDTSFSISHIPKIPPHIQRIHANPALWFVYLLNVTRRCKVFNDGKKKREQWVESFNKAHPAADWEKSLIDKLSISEVQFENTFDCLDPSERQQIYTDINGFLQNIRPNEMRQDTQGFNNVLIGEKKYNLFNDDEFDGFIGLLQTQISLDGREGLVSQIEDDYTSVINQIIADADILFDKGIDEKIKDTSYDKDTIKGSFANDIPKLLKILFYFIYQASHVEDGIAKDYGMSSEFNFVGTTEDGVTNVLETGEWGLCDIHKKVGNFCKSFWSNWKWKLSKDRGAQKMAKGIAGNLESALLNKGQLPDSLNLDAVTFYWQNNAYEYLQYADGYIRSFESGIKHELKFLSTKIKVEKGEDPKEVLKVSVAEKFGGKAMNKDVDFSKVFDTAYAQYIDGKPPTIAVKSDGTGFIKLKQGGVKRKKRTRRKRKIKRKRTRKKRKYKKRTGKKIICISIPNKKDTRKLIKVTKKRAKKTRCRK